MNHPRNLLPIFALLVACGCDQRVDRFPANEVHSLVVAASRRVPAELAAEDTDAVVQKWFGTPLEPYWPSDQLRTGAAKHLVDPARLTRAAGKVFSDQEGVDYGLYQKHCVNCHGVSGGGNGPASLLQNPYPRDFRKGVFKWKSTLRGAKPTRDDLMETLLRGAPGTGMPTFANMPTDDLEALVDYVVFLSVRGEFERRLMSGAIDELGYEETRPEKEISLQPLAQGEFGSEAGDFAVDLLNRVVEPWVLAADEMIDLGVAETVADAESVQRGHELFHGQVAKCFGCHGKDGNADLKTYDFDDWTKEYTSLISIAPDDREALRPFRKAGALRPRQIHPRKLSDGVFRGGGDAQSIYRRIVGGIAGTPMSGVILTEQPSPTSLTASDVWDLVHYVKSLSDSAGSDSARSYSAGSDSAGSDSAGSDSAGSDSTKGADL